MPEIETNEVEAGEIFSLNSESSNLVPQLSRDLLVLLRKLSVFNK